jgi:putative protease
VHLTEALAVGDRIHIFGHTTDLEQAIGSMQIEHHEVPHAEAGDDVGIRVADHVREHDRVYKLVAGADIGSGEHAL